MLKTTNLSKTSSVNRLVKLWAQRYTPDLSLLSSEPNQAAAYGALWYAASPEGRAATVVKLNQRLIELKCQLAAIETNCLYAYMPKVVDFSDAKLLAHCAFAIYHKLLEIYQESADTTYLQPSVIISQSFSSSSWGMPNIEQLIKEIEPLLIAFQGQHIAAQDCRTLGFITTLLNFSNKLIPDRLTLPEQILITPYLRFVEEQVALPWQRVCGAAARHPLDSSVLVLVEQMLPQALDIAHTVYNKLVQLLPNHRSRRGGLDNPGIKHSCVRDLQMFQAYLWLCLLEDTMNPIEHELVDLCVMVMNGVKVKWEMIELWNKLLIEEILSRVTFEQKSMLQPYASAMENAFKNAFKKEHLPVQITPEATQLNAELDSPYQERGRFFFPSERRSYVEELS